MPVSGIADEQGVLLIPSDCDYVLFETAFPTLSLARGGLAFKNVYTSPQFETHLSTRSTPDAFI
jgi:hypothetical protein